jgi:hypothetical protein
MSLNKRLALLALLCIRPATAAFPAGWTQRVSLTIQHGKVPANQTAFPVLLTKATLPAAMLTLGGPGAAQSNGGDIRFSSDILGASQLACEIVVWSQNASPASATAEIWVPVNVLTASDVVIYVWYAAGGGQTQPAANAPFGSQAVWDSGYMGVWHLPDGTTLSANDSTSNTRNLTINGSWPAAAGVVDGGTAAGNGSTQYLTNAAVTTPASITFSAWNFVATGNAMGDALMYWGPSLQAAPRLLVHAPFSDNTMYFDYNTAFGGRISAAFTYDAYNYICATYDTTTHVQNLMVNGVVVSTQTATFANPGLTALFINKLDGTTGKRKVDEPRLSNISRSVNWTLTEYRNQSDPATFVVSGSPVPVGGAPSRSLIGVGQ